MIRFHIMSNDFKKPNYSIGRFTLPIKIILQIRYAVLGGSVSQIVSNRSITYLFVCVCGCVYSIENRTMISLILVIGLLFHLFIELGEKGGSPCLQFRFA